LRHRDNGAGVYGHAVYQRTKRTGASALLRHLHTPALSAHCGFDCSPAFTDFVSSGLAVEDARSAREVTLRSWTAYSNYLSFNLISRTSDCSRKGRCRRSLRAADARKSPPFASGVLATGLTGYAVDTSTGPRRLRIFVRFLDREGSMSKRI